MSKVIIAYKLKKDLPELSLQKGTLFYLEFPPDKDEFKICLTKKNYYYKAGDFWIQAEAVERLDSLFEKIEIDQELTDGSKNGETIEESSTPQVICKSFLEQLTPNKNKEPKVALIKAQDIIIKNRLNAKEKDKKKNKL